MNALWKKYSAKFDAMTLRERLMVFGAAALVAVYLMFLLVVEPLQKREAMLLSQAAQQRADLATLRQQVQLLQQRGGDPDAANKSRKQELSGQIAAIDDNLKTMQKGLVPANRMSALLQDMLARTPRLELVGMKTLPFSTLVEKRNMPADGKDLPPGARAALEESNVFKHGIEITVAGSYADLHDYLARLEKLPWNMLWSRASMTAHEYPKVVLTITVYTLSLDKAWLQV